RVVRAAPGVSLVDPRRAADGVRIKDLTGLTQRRQQIRTERFLPAHEMRFRRVQPVLLGNEARMGGQALLHKGREGSWTTPLVHKTLVDRLVTSPCDFLQLFLQRSGQL